MALYIDVKRSYDRSASPTMQPPTSHVVGDSPLLWYGYATYSFLSVRESIPLLLQVIVPLIRDHVGTSCSERWKQFFWGVCLFALAFCVYGLLYSYVSFANTMCSLHFFPVAPTCVRPLESER